MVNILINSLYFFLSEVMLFLQVLYLAYFQLQIMIHALVVFALIFLALI